MEMDESETEPESSIQERTEEIIEDERNTENGRNAEDEISENEGKIDENSSQIDSDSKSEDFSDYSDDSDLTDESISEFKTEEEETREDVFDKIIDAFTVKRRKPYFDQEDQDLVNFEESRKRLFILAIISATILCIVATSLLILQLPKSNRILVLTPKMQQVKNRKVYPHIIVLFFNGEIEAFKHNGTLLEHSWSFQLPKVQDETGYLLYSKQSRLFILNSNGAKNVISISKSSSSDLIHNMIPNSQIPDNWFYTPRSVQVGHQFWIFGGKNGYKYAGDFDPAKWFTIGNPNVMKFGRHKNTLIWNTRKKVFYHGPDLSYGQCHLDGRL